MEKPMARYHWSIIIVHWLLTLCVVASLVVGWYQSRLPTDSDRWFDAFHLHGALGITGFIFVLLLFILRLIIKTPPHSSHISIAQAVFANVLHGLLYIVILLMAVSGYLQAVYSGRNVWWWYLNLPTWGHPDPVLGELFNDIHSLAAYGLTVLILTHIVTVFVYAQFEPGFIRRILPGRAQTGQSMVPAPSAVPTHPRKWLARTFVIFGWAGFGLQFSIAVLSILILLFASSGSLVSPDSAGIELGIFWANFAIAVLVFTAILSIYFIRTGKKLARADKNNMPFSLVASLRLLKVGIIASLAGVILALIGTGMSITVFISKVVSQPPGIAITDPQRIIRALDVFVLLANVNVIAGHVFGIIIWLWLFWRTLGNQAQTRQPGQVGSPSPEAAT